MYKESYEIDDTFLLLDLNRQKFANVVSFDFSDCINMDFTSFIDMVCVVKCLKVLKYRNCTQITEYNIQRIADLCPFLREIDGSGASTVSSTVAFGIIYTLRSLQNFAVEPRAIDLAHWMQIKWQFSGKIKFGACIISALPKNGNVRNLVRTLEQKMSECTGACKIKKL